MKPPMSPLQIRGRAGSELAASENEKLGEQEEAQQLAEDDITGEILAVKVTRSGHMFAAITRSTLTIWQTKVSSYPLAYAEAQLLMHLTAYRHPRLGSALAAIIEYLRSQCRHPSAPRLADLRSANHAWISHHVFPCDRPYFACLQDPIRPYWRRTFPAAELAKRLQDTPAS